MGHCVVMIVAPLKAFQLKAILHLLLASEPLSLVLWVVPPLFLCKKCESATEKKIRSNFGIVVMDSVKLEEEKIRNSTTDILITFFDNAGIHNAESEGYQIVQLYVAVSEGFLQSFKLSFCNAERVFNSGTQFGDSCVVLLILLFQLNFVSLFYGSDVDEGIYRCDKFDSPELGL